MNLDSCNLQNISSLLTDKISKISSNNALSLFHGDLCMAFTYYHHYKLSQNKKSYRIFKFHLLKIMNIQDKTVDYSYVNGLSGLLYFISQLEADNTIDIEHQQKVTIEEYLISSYRIIKNQKDFDFFYGLGGICFGLLSSNSEYAKEAVSGLIDIAQIDNENNIFWYRQPYHPDDSTSVNFGFPHGNFSIIMLLLLAYQKGICKTQCKETIVKSLAFTSKFQKESGSNLFPIDLDSKLNLRNTVGRLAYCYGDLSIGFTFYRCGIVLGIKSYIDIAMKIIRNSAVIRNDPRNIDCCFCHGSAGIAFIFQYFFIKTKDPLFQEASKFWQKDLLKKWNGKIEGLYYANWNEKNQQYVYENNNSLLEGYPGILLAIESLSKKNTELLKWANCFYIDL